MLWHVDIGDFALRYHLDFICEFVDELPAVLNTVSPVIRIKGYR